MFPSFEVFNSPYLKCPQVVGFCVRREISGTLASSSFVVCLLRGDVCLGNTIEIIDWELRKTQRDKKTETDTGRLMKREDQILAMLIKKLNMNYPCFRAKQLT